MTSDQVYHSMAPSMVLMTLIWKEAGAFTSRAGCYIRIVKRKRTSAAVNAEMPAVTPSEVVPQELLERAKRAVEVDRLPKPARCSVCNEDCAPISSEGLCWVCRRLKLSAWRDSDMQMPAQE